MKIVYIVCLFLLLFVGVVSAEQKLISSEVTIARNYNNATCNFTVTTEDWDKTFDCYSNESNTYDLDFITEVECQADERYRNMTSICMGVSTQYSQMLPNMNYVDKYANCNGELRSAVDLRDVYKAQNTNLTGSLSFCTSEKGVYETNYKDCITVRDSKFTEDDCKKKYTKDNMWTGIFIGLGLFGAWYWNKNRSQRVRGGGEEFEDEDLTSM